MAELSGAIGSVGTYDVKATVDEIDLSVGVKIPVKAPVLAYLTALDAKLSNAVEKEALQLIINAIQAQP